MQAFFSSLVDDAIIKLVALGAVVGLVAGVFAGVIQKRHGSIGAWVRGIIVAVFVGTVAALCMESVAWPPAMEIAVIAVAAYTGEDVLAGIAAVMKMFGADPLGAATRVWDALKGGGPKP